VSEDRTQDIPDGRSFEERVFARFDALESQLSDVKVRLERLEQKSYDTKPIWERALAEILAVGEKVDSLGDRMHSLERKFNVLGRDMLTLRGDQERIEDRMDKLESKPVQ
jgi:chromosome segregation ATPase